MKKIFVCSLLLLTTDQAVGMDFESCFFEQNDLPLINMSDELDRMEQIVNAFENENTPITQQDVSQSEMQQITSWELEEQKSPNNYYPENEEQGDTELEQSDSDSANEANDTQNKNYSPKMIRVPCLKKDCKYVYKPHCYDPSHGIVNDRFHNITSSVRKHLQNKHHTFVINSQKIKDHVTIYLNKELQTENLPGTARALKIGPVTTRTNTRLIKSSIIPCFEKNESCSYIYQARHSYVNVKTIAACMWKHYKKNHPYKHSYTKIRKLIEAYLK